MRPSLVSTKRPAIKSPAETQLELLGNGPSEPPSSVTPGPSGSGSRATSGSGSRATSGSGSRATSGSGSRATSGSGSRATSGSGSRALVGRLVAWGLAAAAFGTSTQALAQEQIWLKDRKYTEGAGIRVGDFELHPGVAAEVGFDSNYLRRADSDGPAGSVRLRVTPSLSLATLGPQRTGGAPNATPPDVEFRGTASLTYNEFFGVSGPALTKDSLSQDRNIGGNLDLSLNIFPRREWSGSLYAGVGRTSQPNEAGGLGQFSGLFDRFLTRAGAELAWTPGAGLLDWRLGYRFAGTIFQANEVSGLTNVDNQIQMRGRWRFLPRTAMLYDAKFGFVNYVNATAGGGTGVKTSSHPVRVQLGVNGLITPSFGLLVMAGYGGSFYDATPRSAARDFDSVIGQAEVKWYLTPNPSSEPGAATLSVSTLSLGFLRDFQDSYIGTYIERDRGYANLSYFFGGRFLVVVEGGAGPVVYPKVDVTKGGSLTTLPSWTDIRYDASVFGEYRLKDYFGINATVRYSGNASQQAIPVPNGSDGTTYPDDSLQWQSFEAYLGARFLM